jgi:flagellar hook-associated protein 3 FlgL
MYSKYLTMPLSASRTSRISSARGEAGEWLNRADNIAGAQDRRTLQLTTDKSRFEDLDMVKGISDYQKVQTGYQAALQSYAQVQKLSLFNYIS